MRVGKTVQGALEVQTFAWIETQQVSDFNQVSVLQADLDHLPARKILSGVRFNSGNVGDVIGLSPLN